MRIVLALLVVLLAAAPADAQFRRSQKPFAEKGDLAVLVEVSGLDNLQLRSALGGVGLRYRVADQTALGVSVGLDGFSASSGGDQTFDTDGSAVRVSTWFEQHLGRPSRIVSPFVGAGVQFSARSNTNRNGDGTGSLESEQTRIGVGGGILFGAEVRLAKAVTLGAAYTLGVEYQRDEQTLSSGLPGSDVTVRSQDAVRYGTGLTNLGLSVYF